MNTRKFRRELNGATAEVTQMATNVTYVLRHGDKAYDHQVKGLTLDEVVERYFSARFGWVEV